VDVEEARGGYDERGRPPHVKLHARRTAVVVVGGSGSGSGSGGHGGGGRGGKGKGRVDAGCTTTSADAGLHGDDGRSKEERDVERGRRDEDDDVCGDGAPDADQGTCQRGSQSVISLQVCHSSQHLRHYSFKTALKTRYSNLAVSPV